jgi:hypothetical protein
MAAAGPERRLLQGLVTAGAEGTLAVAEAGEPAPVPPAIRALRARRRRRRRPPEAGPEGASPAQAPAALAESGSAAENTAPAARATSAQDTPAQPPRHRRRRRPASGAETRTERPPRDDREPRQGGRDGPGRQGERGPRGERREGRRDAGPRDRRGRPPGRGRAAPPRKVERKLYQTDSVVDRGFEDIEEEGETRRVHWTIVKRTTADQISRKAMSAVYVLQRDGADNEFPSLGAARSAVNKTIVHPEKLTRSKAEYAAEKK